MTKQDILHARLTYYCQPIYDTHVCGWSKAELLIRAWGPGMAQYPTEEFIHAAECFGMIGNIDLAALRHACRMLPCYRKKGIVQLSVNISPRSLREEAFLQKAEAILQMHREACRHLVVEITESVPGEKEGWMLTALERLMQCGVDIAVDDFGKDNAGIFRILNMPFRYIKLDKSLTAQCRRDPFAHLVTEKLAEAMHLAGKDVIAEGVEAAAQVQELKQMGIRYLQGYYWSPPVPETKFLGVPAQNQRKTPPARQSCALLRHRQNGIGDSCKEAKPPGSMRPAQHYRIRRRKTAIYCANSKKYKERDGILSWEKH